MIVKSVFMSLGFITLNDPAIIGLSKLNTLWNLSFSHFLQLFS